VDKCKVGYWRWAFRTLGGFWKILKDVWKTDLVVRYGIYSFFISMGIAALLFYFFQMFVFFIIIICIPIICLLLSYGVYKEKKRENY